MSSLGERMKIEAKDTQPGDFTCFSGFRCAVAVNSTTGRRTRFHRVDGTSEAIPRTDLITVYRPARLAPTFSPEASQVRETP